MMLAPWGTAWNIASAPITNKYEYPVIYTTAGDSILYTKANNWPYAFWSLSQPHESVQPLIDWLVQLKKDGKIKGRVAAINSEVQQRRDKFDKFVGPPRRERPTAAQPTRRETLQSDRSSKTARLSHCYADLAPEASLPIWSLDKRSIA
jgi:hypothetical protein